jgi:hypothetical protein
MRSASSAIMRELLIRFALGGAIVSVFSLTGELFQPKTFAGLFGAAPAVAIASLALAFRQHGAGYAAAEARSMVIGSLAMLVYSAACAVLAQRHGVPVWLAAGLAWAAWLASAFAAFGLASAGGLL